MKYANASTLLIVIFPLIVFSQQQKPAVPRIWDQSPAEYLKSAQFWVGDRAGTPAASAQQLALRIQNSDLFTGPFSQFGFTKNQNLVCEDVSKNVTGTSPKVFCKFKPFGDEVFKIKLFEPRKIRWVKHERSKEIFTEILSTNLFRILGFPADIDVAVKLDCTDCKTYRGVHSLATLDLNYPGKKIENTDDEGWSFEDLISFRDQGKLKENRAYVDAFLLLASFVKHNDSRPEQQKIVCPKNQVFLENGFKKCAVQPTALIADLGATFSNTSGKLFSFAVLNLKNWSKAPVWKDPRKCIAHNDQPFYSPKGLHDPSISEAGRSFLATLLEALSDEQIYDLFHFARVEKFSGNVDEWVRVFKLKRDDIINARCPQ